MKVLATSTAAARTRAGRTGERTGDLGLERAKERLQKMHSGKRAGTKELLLHRGIRALEYHHGLGAGSYRGGVLAVATANLLVNAKIVKVKFLSWRDETHC